MAVNYCSILTLEKVGLKLCDNFPWYCFITCFLTQTGDNTVKWQYTVTVEESFITLDLGVNVIIFFFFFWGGGVIYALPAYFVESLRLRQQ
jgi:hypothetical protein